MKKTRKKAEVCGSVPNLVTADENTVVEAACGNSESSDGGCAEKRSEKATGGTGITFVFDKNTVKYLILIIAFGVILFWSLHHTDSLLGFISYIFALFSPVFIGMALGFIINVPMRGLEKLWKKAFSKVKSSRVEKVAEKLRRPVCLILSIVLIIGVLFALFFMILPEFHESLSSLIASMPTHIPKLENLWHKLVEFAENFGAVIPELSLDTDKIMGLAGNVFESLLGTGNVLVNKTLHFTTSLFSAVTNFVVAFVFAIYLLARKENLGNGMKKMLLAYLPQKKVDSVLEVASLTSKTFSNFVTGQLAEAVIIGVLCFFGMLIFGMPYPAVVSVLVGVTALIPVFGAYVGTCAGALLILLSSPIKALWFVIFIIVLQQLEGNLIYPKVVGRSVGLPGIWVMACVVVGGNAFGLVGMLFAVPVCAVLYSLLRKNVNERIKKKERK